MFTEDKTLNRHLRDDFGVFVTKNGEKCIYSLSTRFGIVIICKDEQNISKEDEDDILRFFISSKKMYNALLAVNKAFVTNTTELNESQTEASKMLNEALEAANVKKLFEATIAKKG